MASAVQVQDQRILLNTPTAGLILLNAQNRVVYQNPEALRILGYPDETKPRPVLLPRLLDTLLDRNASSEFTSGRRRYLSRSFSLAQGNESSDQPCTGILLERAGPNFIDISAAAQQFGLTQREQETVELLTLGLTSKEIASRMKISPNTVKAFFRLVMTKMAVNTRSGIVGKIARIQSLA